MNRIHRRLRQSWAPTRATRSDQGERMVCRYTQGSTSGQNGEGPAHFTLGMKRNLTLT